MAAVLLISSTTNQPGCQMFVQRLGQQGGVVVGWILDKTAMLSLTGMPMTG
jgi:hypothetical protein